MPTTPRRASSTTRTSARARSRLAPPTTPPARTSSAPAAGTPPSDSPGTWRHPRLDEITRRKRAATFNDQNARMLAYCALHFVLLWLADQFVGAYLPTAFAAPWWYIKWSAAMLRIGTLAIAALPLYRAIDDLSDIPLSPGQRKLLGLPPSSAPASPDTRYTTPPRYSRTPASVGGSLQSPRAGRGGEPLAYNPGASAYASAGFDPRASTFSNASFDPRASAYSNASFDPRASTTSSALFDPRASVASNATFDPRASIASNAAFDPRASIASNATFDPRASILSTDSSLFNFSPAPAAPQLHYQPHRPVAYLPRDPSPRARFTGANDRRYSIGATAGSPQHAAAARDGMLFLNASPAAGGLGGDPAIASPSPSPAKRTSVAVNSKWLFERGRRPSGTWGC